MAALRIVGALSLVCVVLPGAAETVENLTSENFDARIQEEDIILVKFYAPWCGHCKAMAPAYEEAAQQLIAHSPPIPLGKVDATVETQLPGKFGINGYPTLKIFRKGRVSNYDGPRDATGIVEHMKKQAQMRLLHGDEATAAALDEDHTMLMATLCRDQLCNDPKFPMIEYDERENRCHCAAHPCWDDNGQVHSCGTDKAPHLTFSYTKEGVLECGCRAEPHYTSKYIAQVKCPGEHCEGEEHPILDYDPKEKKCVCKGHPCHDLNGVKHDCADPAFPILFYREEKDTDGSVKQICECKAGIAYAKHTEL